VGSQALREIGRLVGRVVEDYVGVAARYGGDEYVVVMPGGDHDELKDLAERLRQTIEAAEIVCEGEPGQEPIVLVRAVTASIGAASLQHLNRPGRDPIEARQALIREADKAMYVAKALGKNRVHWAPDQVGELPPLQPRR
jgi:diguanylate cyclase (GGDEF)-like protein